MAAMLVAETITQSKVIMPKIITSNAPMFDYVLPRPDLQESAFRRYEVFIATGCLKDCIVDPAPLSPRTFVARFNDAKRGYIIYKYSSNQIPSGFDVSKVRAEATKSGIVAITCSNRAIQLDMVGSPLQMGRSMPISSSTAESPEAAIFKAAMANATKVERPPEC